MNIGVRDRLGWRIRGNDERRGEGVIDSERMRKKRESGKKVGEGGREVCKCRLGFIKGSRPNLLPGSLFQRYLL